MIILLSIVKKVLYIGDNIKLVEALLPINSTSANDVSIVHYVCVNEIETIISEDNYHHLICDRPVFNAVKKRITEKYPDMQCLYLTDEEPCLDDVSILPPAMTVGISDEVKSALDCISLPLYYKDLQGFIIYCNTYFSQIFGLLPDDLIGQPLDKVLPDGIVDKVKKSTLRMFNDDHYVRLLEFEMRDVTGIKREFLIREEVTDDSDHQIGMLFDSSEMNAAKAAIEKERVMLRATANLSSDLIFFKDLESRFIGCNKQFEEFVGCPEADIIGKKDDQLFELNQAKMCQAQDTQVIENNEIYVNNEFLTYNNGEKHYIFMQKVPLEDKDGKVQGLIAIGRDITEKSIIKKQLKLANAVFENSRDGILVTDNKGMVITANDACLDIAGYTKSELLNQNIASFAYGGDYRRLFINIERALKNKGKWQGDVTFYTKKGDLGYFWLEVYQIKDSETEIDNRVYSFTDLTQNKYNEEKIQYLSKHDSLTGLNNRIALFNHLETAIARSNHKQIPMGILFIEIKGIKAINERHGHNQGDLVFRGVAKRLKQSASDKDYIARIGDDQFVLVIDEFDNEQVIALIARQIAQQFSETMTIEGVAVDLSLSIGISICPDDGMDVDMVLSNAETAMLRSKRDKSSTYHFYTNELTVHSTHQLARENELKLALIDDQFEVYYQPQYDLNKRRVVAVECILRWHHPEQGLLLPERFLMLAEQSGVLIELGIEMFTQAAKQAVKWHHSGIKFGRIALPLSKLELSQLSLIGSLQKVLLDTGAKANWFEFEIEESLFRNVLYRVQENLLNLSRLGIALTVEGFGAERSVLYSIDKLNIDKFKISKHFIQGVPGFLAGEAMLKSVFVLANSLGIDVVGETIENDPCLTNDKIPVSDKWNNQKEVMTATEATFYLRCNKRK